jgi:hypothetical protein
VRPKTPPGSKYDVPAVVFYARPLKSPAKTTLPDDRPLKCELVHMAADFPARHKWRTLINLEGADLNYGDSAFNWTCRAGEGEPEAH